MSRSKSDLTWNVAAVATIGTVVPGLRRTSSHRRRERFVVGLISLICCARGLGAYVESDGLVVVEAEHYENTTSASAHSWIPTNNPAGFVGDSAMVVAPNTGANIGADIPNASSASAPGPRAT